VKVIIQPHQAHRKTYTNLPEREQHKRDRQRPPQPHAPEDLAVPLEQLDGEAEEYISADLEEVPESWRNSPWTRFLFIAAVLVLSGIAYFAVGFEHDQRLEGISVEGAEQLTDKEIISLADIDRSQRFYDIDLKEVTARVLNHSLVKAVYPRRETNPARIVIKVEERQPVAMIRSRSGEVLLIDREGKVLRPKRLSGLKDPEAMLRVPLLSGITETDTVSYLAMSRLVQSLAQLDDGSLMKSMGELKKTSTGAYVLYTEASHTPIFLGSPKDEPFIAALELERDPEKAQERREASLFEKQVKMLAAMWKQNLAQTVQRGQAVYIKFSSRESLA
jgi:hypothetical protein